MSGVDGRRDQNNFVIRTHMQRSLLGSERHFECIRAPAILRTFGADPQGSQAVGQHHIAQGAGERLLFDMGVHEFSIGDLVACFIDEFPAVGIMVPACVGVRECDVKAPPHTRARSFDLGDGRGVCESGCARCARCERGEKNKLFDHTPQVSLLRLKFTTHFCVKPRGNTAGLKESFEFYPNW